MTCIFALSTNLGSIWWSSCIQFAWRLECITGLLSGISLWLIDGSVKTWIQSSCSPLNLLEDVFLNSITWFIDQERILAFPILSVTLLLGLLLVEYQVICEEVGESFEQVNLLIELLHRFVVRLSLQLDLPLFLFYLVLDMFDLSLHLLTLSSDLRFFIQVLFDYGGMCLLKGLKLLIEGLSIFPLLNLHRIYTSLLSFWTFDLVYTYFYFVIISTIIITFNITAVFP